MEFILRTLALIVSFLAVIINTLLNWTLPRRKPTYSPIKNKLLTKSVSELVVELRNRKITSEQVVRAYIERIQEVNQSLNAVIEDRFEDALKEAQHADKLIAKTNNEQLLALFFRYPLLGIPFTVKEACAVKGLSFVVGNVHRKRIKCSENSEVIERLRAAGCIPLLVSANPEFCYGFETNTLTHGRCLNPYDLNRTSAGSSGGEGALNGCGATPFGVGSDIAGSIRLPALFCGIFGHKPTGGLLSVKGHFPHSSTDLMFPTYLQLGPITRFARDLPILLQVMAGDNAEKLKFAESLPLKDIKIYYSFGFGGFNRFTHAPLTFDIKLAIVRAVKCFEKGGILAKEVQVKGFKHVTEMCVAALIDMEGIPNLLTHTPKMQTSRKALICEMLRSLIGHSLYTKEALFMELMKVSKAFMSSNNREKWNAEVEPLRKELLELLGVNGVLFFPTFHSPATCFHTSIFNMVGVDMMLIFNILGFPATNVPMGLDHRGMPIGFQVVAAPYQDKLCFQIAAELEGAFGGWEPPLRHELNE